MSLQDPSPRSPAPRETLAGRWDVESVLPGAMGTVLLLRDPATGGRFAAKTPRVESGLSPETLRRFEVEARTWLSLGHHRNVVEAIFYEALEWRGVVRPFLFLEYVDGPTLDRLLRTERRLAVPVVLDFATGIAWGMAHAHGDGRAGSRIVHRDLKPDNVFVTRDRVVKVSDFGIARALDRPEEQAGEGLGLGTPFYAAPEQMRDARRADVRSDVYSFGALAFHLAAGEPPFPANDLSTLVVKVLRETARPLRELRPEVPEGFERLVADCLAKEPSARPANFTEVLERVSEVREIDTLWAPAEGARSCDACGWLSVASGRTCALCGKRMTRGRRYAPVAPRWHHAIPTMGRVGNEAELLIEGVLVRPRTPRAGEEVVITVLVGNRGGVPAEGAALAYVRPSSDAFAFVESGARRGFRGTVAPTADGAPLRISWRLRPLREGKWTLRAPRITWRGPGGARRAARGESLEIVVEPNDRVPLVGRSAEMLELGRLVDAAAAGTGALAAVVGRPGMGKSRVLRAASALAAERGFATVRGRCLDRGVEVRGALKEAAKQLLELPKSGAAPSEVAAALVQLLGDATRSEPRLLAFLLDELVGRPLGPGEGAPHLWSRFAVVAGRARPILLAVEDVQRDPEVGAIVCDMVQACRNDGASFLAILSVRPESEDADDLVRRVEDDAVATGLARVLHLGAFSRAEVEDVLAAAFQPNDFERSAPWLADELLAISGGNPMFVSELLRSLRAHASGPRPPLATQGGAWTAGPGLSPERLRELVPPRIDQLVVERIAALDPVVRRFAAAAAVLGDVFETDLLRRVLDDPDTFDASLAALETRGILREVSGEPPRIRFREPLLPEAVHRELRATNPEECARLHGRAAEILAGSPGADGAYALRLARHRASSGRTDEGFRSYLDAVRRLVARHAYRRAAAVLDEARKLLDGGLRPRRTDRLEYARLRGDVLLHTSDYEGALAAFRDVIDDSGSGRRVADSLGGIYSAMGKAHEALGQLDDALYCYAVGLSLRRDEGRADEIPLSLVNLAGLHLARGETDRANDYVDEALAASETADNPRALGRALVLKARLLVGRGAMREARPLLRRGLRESRVARDGAGTADAWVVVGQAAFREGRLQRAIVHFRRALAIRQGIGDLAAVAGSWGTLGAVEEAMDDLESAQAAYQRAVDLTRRIGSRRGLALSLTNLGRVQLAAGAPRKARATFEEARETARPLGEALFVGPLLADLAEALRRLGDVAESETLLAEARRIVSGKGDHEIEAHVMLRTASALAAQGRRGEAADAARRALALPGVSPGRRAELLSELADSAADGEEAGQAVADASQIASALPGTWVRARTLATSGALALRAGDAPRAAASLRQAAGLLMNLRRWDAFLVTVLRLGARAMEPQDPEAAAGARRRADELTAELRARGYAAGPGTAIADDDVPDSPAADAPPTG